jgi:uncharacterized protein YrrD
MRKGSDILNKSIIAFDTGKRVARVQDLIFDQETNHFLGVLVEEAGLFRSAKVIELSSLRAIGTDTLIISSRDDIISAKHNEQIHRVLDRNIILKGKRIVTTDGQFLGSVVDFFFDEQTGAIEGYEASGGIFADAYSGRSFIPAPQTLRIGEDVTFVPPETVALMEEQVGGIRGAMQTASTRVQESSELAGQKIQAAAQAANQQLQQGSEAANLRLQAAAQAANQQFQQGSEAANLRLQSATQGLRDRFIDPDEQFAYIIGKTVDRDVFTDQGQLLVAKDQVITIDIAEHARLADALDDLYRATGGSSTPDFNRRFQDANERVGTGFQEISDRVNTGFQSLSQRANENFSSFTARLGLEQAKGRRADRMIRSDTGAIIVAPGQIVTDIVVQRATAAGQEVTLLDAVGLQPTEALRGNTNQSLTLAKTQFQREASLATSQFHQEAAIASENLRTLWNNAKGKFAEYQGRSEKAIYRNRVEQALGRPVNRVILDSQDNVILNVGEIITHKAIQQAEDSGVINILLNSVYTKEPTIREEELRAPEVGIASLEREHARAGNGVQQVN